MQILTNNLMRAKECSAILACLALATCTSSNANRTFCQNDFECPGGFICRLESGLCWCTNDTACHPDEFCHLDGQCKKKMSCNSNLDCPEDTFCDSREANCLQLGKCTKDIQCPIGQICSFEEYSPPFECITGCRQHGDCPLGDVCLFADQEGPGECTSNRCVDKSYCDYGQLCLQETMTCIDDERGPYCSYCSSSTIYDPHSCGEGPNFCLVRAGDLTLPPYCGVDCSGPDQPCPNGYGCFSVRIVYTSDWCTKNEDCSSGICHIKEGDDKGFCLCVKDGDCPQNNSCDELTMQCRITRKFCIPENDDCRPVIPCIDGYCHIGYNCKPMEGLRCEDLRS